MGLFKKKPDPINDRSRKLEAQIAALESQIKQLNAKAHRERPQPRARSTALPQGQQLSAPSLAQPSTPLRREPIFESLDHKNMTNLSESENTPGHFNDLGIRKYDLIAAWRRFRNHFHGPATPNPKLVSYLAAGTIKGLRPLRYEKRVARNRFIALSILLLLLILGVLTMFLKQR